MSEQIQLYQSLPPHSEDGVSQRAYMEHLRERFGESIDDGKCWHIDKATAQIHPDDKDPYNGLQEVAIQWVPVEQEYQVVTLDDGDKRDHRYCGDYYGATERLTDQMVWDMTLGGDIAHWLGKQQERLGDKVKQIEQMLAQTG